MISIKILKDFIVFLYLELGRIDEDYDEILK